MIDNENMIVDNEEVILEDMNEMNWRVNMKEFLKKYFVKEKVVDWPKLVKRQVLNHLTTDSFYEENTVIPWICFYLW